MIEPVGEHARKLERDAIVAWLRAAESDYSNDYAIGAMHWAAESIERGDHLESGE